MKLLETNCWWDGHCQTFISYLDDDIYIFLFQKEIWKYVMWLVSAKFNFLGHIQICITNPFILRYTKSWMKQ